MALDYGRTLTILVVEDDEAVAELIRTVLNRVSGWGATVVHDAAAASEVFRHVEIEVLVLSDRSYVVAQKFNATRFEEQWDS